MIRHIYSVLCSKSTTDRETNNISLIEVLEQLQITFHGAEAVPRGVPFSAELVTLWARSDPQTPARGEARTRLLDPDGNELGGFVTNIPLEDASRHRHQAKIDGLRLVGDGWYNWEVSYRVLNTDTWEVVASLPLEVSVVLQQAAPAS